MSGICNWNSDFPHVKSETSCRTKQKNLFHRSHVSTCIPLSVVPLVISVRLWPALQVAGRCCRWRDDRSSNVDKSISRTGPASASFWHTQNTSLTTRHYRPVMMTNTHTHTCLTALCPGLSRWAGTRKVKPIWILLKQETVSGSGINWAICKSAPRSRQITTPAHTTQFFRFKLILMIMPKLQLTYDECLVIYKTSYKERKAFLRYDSLAQS